ncbi:hypothetical protein [Clostridium beijerinckii]|uniref:hypothetical protein n=1 Tax=Clostridium beijerinckii TaxID=1520 RepID=UPI00156F99A6|nr:hypothetical protein [Clostridium beijerinckii]NRU52368.1 hypothetical protein [Clostridium beijerinckii]NRU52667.1 hypothetical protein [Clostridium beijerinckii]NYC68710.1 hypothetical protein [Clostridium beijerinckii]NYC91859.1 hypothetical protein [Clostridium beijerinckii]
MFLLTMHITLIKIAVTLYILNKIKLFIQRKVLKRDKTPTKKDVMDIVNVINPDESKRYIASSMLDVFDNNKLLVELMCFVMCFVPIVNIFMIIMHFIGLVSKPNNTK